MISEEERGVFAPFADGEFYLSSMPNMSSFQKYSFSIDHFNEELSALHELEVEKLKQERRIKKPVLSAIKRYSEICNEEWNSPPLL